MALPNDTTIQQLAKVFDVSSDKLSPAASKLTKGDLVALLGTTDEGTAVLKYAQFGTPPPAETERFAVSAGLKLTVDDINSIHGVFGSPAIPVTRLLLADKTTAAALSIGGTGTLGAGGTLRDPISSPISVSVYACCCPCCCATAVIRPGQNAVA